MQLHGHAVHVAALCSPRRRRSCPGAPSAASGCAVHGGARTRRGLRAVARGHAAPAARVADARGSAHAAAARPHSGRSGRPAGRRHPPALHAAQLGRGSLPVSRADGAVDRSRPVSAAACSRCSATRSATRPSRTRSRRTWSCRPASSGRRACSAPANTPRTACSPSPSISGRTPWTARMVDLTVDAMRHAPVASRFGALPASDSELNGDYLQVLVRLEAMTGDPRFAEWARRIGDAYVEEVLPGNHGVPSMQWDFGTHTGDGRLRLRDHGNEIIVGLTLQFALEDGVADAARASLASGHRPDARSRAGVRERRTACCTTRSTPRRWRRARRQLSDNWGYVLRRRLRLLSGHGRDAVSRRGAPRAAARCPAIATTCGNRAPPQPTCRSDPSTATPTRSRVRSTW